MENQLGRISVIRQFGDELYLGRNRDNQSKVLVRNYRMYPGDRLAFTEQCKFLLELYHPNLIAINEVLESSNGVALVMEYASGGSLVEYLAHKRASKESISLDLALYITQNILKSVGYIHEQGLLAKDIRPVKVLFMGDGIVKLADISDAYLIDHRLGTLPELVLTGYEPPEVLLGGNDSPQSDLYMVGEMLYEMVTGNPPFPIDTVDSLYQRIGFGEFTKPSAFVGDLPADLNEIIVMAMSVNPADRFQNASAMYRALDSCFP